MMTGHTEHPHPALQTAHTTLLNGCRFLIARAMAPDRDAPDLQTFAKIALRMAGNHLKELDRFLAHMVDQCETPATQASHRRLMNRHRPRLRAIQRVRIAACFGPIDVFAKLQTGRPLARDLAMASAGASMRGRDAETAGLGDHVLAEIARFYITLADQIYALWAQHMLATTQHAPAAAKTDEAASEMLSAAGPCRSNPNVWPARSAIS